MIHSNIYEENESKPFQENMLRQEDSGDPYSAPN